MKTLALFTAIERAGARASKKGYFLLMDLQEFMKGLAINEACCWYVANVNIKEKSTQDPDHGFCEYFWVCAKCPILHERFVSRICLPAMPAQNVFAQVLDGFKVKISKLKDVSIADARVSVQYHDGNDILRKYTIIQLQPEQNEWKIDTIPLFYCVRGCIRLDLTLAEPVPHKFLWIYGHFRFLDKRSMKILGRQVNSGNIISGNLKIVNKKLIAIKCIKNGDLMYNG